MRHSFSFLDFVLSFLTWPQVERLVEIICPTFVSSLEDYFGRGNLDNLCDAWIHWCNLYRTNHNDLVEEQHEDRSLDDLLRLDDFWQISENEHRTLLTYWTTEARNSAEDSVRRSMQEYEMYRSEYNDLQTLSNLACLKRASVVGMTTTYVAKHQKLLGGLMPKVVILEEAAEVLEAHVLSCLSSSTQQLIMIGDHKQLRPKLDQWILQAESNAGFNLDMSIFERLITQNKIQHVTLHSQRRMRPQFSK